MGCLSKKALLTEVPTEVRLNMKFRVPNPCPDLQWFPSAPQLSASDTEPPRAQLLSVPSQQKDIHPLQSLSAVYAQLQWNPVTAAAALQALNIDAKSYKKLRDTFWLKDDRSLVLKNVIALVAFINQSKDHEKWQSQEHFSLCSDTAQDLYWSSIQKITP